MFHGLRRQAQCPYLPGVYRYARGFACAEQEGAGIRGGGGTGSQLYHYKIFQV